MFDLVLQGGCIITDEKEFIGQLAINDGKIVQLSQTDKKLEGTITVNCEGKLILPGLLDLHVHFNDPGVTYREDFLTGSRAAAAGGVTLIADMPLANIPVTTTVSALKEKKKVAAEKAVIDYGLWAGLVDNNLDEFDEMVSAGAYGFKAFTCDAGEDYPMATSAIVLEALHKSKSSHTFVGVHCEENDLIMALKRDSVLSNKQDDLEQFLHSHHPETETISVAKMIALAETSGGHLHICHASLPETVTMVEEAKTRGVKVSVETCPQYLLFSEHDLKDIGGPLKCTPPVRDKNSVDTMWQMLLEDKVDFLVSDHSPATKEEKDNNQPFSKNWGGINGVQFLFPLLYNEGVINRGFPLNKLVKLCASSPAKFMGVYPERGVLEEGSEANFIIFDPDRKWIINEAVMQTKNKQSPYLGLEVQGLIESTWIRGQKICEVTDRSVTQIATPGSGRFYTKRVTENR